MPETNQTIAKTVLVIIALLFVCTAACSSGEDNPYASCNFLDIRGEMLWSGYYRETYLYLDSLDPEDVGPEVSVDDSTVRVEWKAVVYEDCQIPDTACLIKDGSNISVTLISLECPFELEDGHCMCADNDFVSNISTSFELESGSYIVTTDCHVSGFYKDTCNEVGTDIVVK